MLQFCAHDGVDACELLDDCNDGRDDKLRPIAGPEKSAQGVLDGVCLACLINNVLELLFDVLLAPDDLQNLYAQPLLCLYIQNCCTALLEGECHLSPASKFKAVVACRSLQCLGHVIIQKFHIDIL